MNSMDFLKSAMFTKYVFLSEWPESFMMSKMSFFKYSVNIYDEK